MKKILLSLSLFVLISSFALSSFDDVINAVKLGDAAKLSIFFDNTVEITLPEKSNSYSKSQAEIVLHDFFASNPVKNFEILHKGDNAGSQYCIGNLQTNGGTYRTTIYMKLKADKEVLQALRFEK
jgi:hypothetical protein